MGESPHSTAVWVQVRALSYYLLRTQEGLEEGGGSGPAARYAGCGWPFQDLSVCVSALKQEVWLN